MTMLIVYEKVHTVLLVLLYRDQTLFGHYGAFCSNTNPMLLGSVTQESPDTLVAMLNVAQENSDIGVRSGAGCQNRIGCQN